jgi:hypothetical protein
MRRSETFDGTGNMVVPEGNVASTPERWTMKGALAVSPEGVLPCTVTRKSPRAFICAMAGGAATIDVRLKVVPELPPVMNVEIDGGFTYGGRFNVISTSPANAPNRVTLTVTGTL